MKDQTTKKAQVIRVEQQRWSHPDNPYISWKVFDEYFRRKKDAVAFAEWADLTGINILSGSKLFDFFDWLKEKDLDIYYSFKGSVKHD